MCPSLTIRVNLGMPSYLYAYFLSCPPLICLGNLGAPIYPPPRRIRALRTGAPHRLLNTYRRTHTPHHAHTRATPPRLSFLSAKKNGRAKTVKRLRANTIARPVCTGRAVTCDDISAAFYQATAWRCSLSNGYHGAGSGGQRQKPVCGISRYYHPCSCSRVRALPPRMARHKPGQHLHRAICPACLSTLASGRQCARIAWRIRACFTNL